MLGTPKKGRRFGGSSAHQKAMMGNLVASLIAAEYLVTTEAKAKALRPVAEKVITAAAKGGVARQRNVVAFIRDKDMANKLFVEIGPRYAERPGGYTRILKLGNRLGRQRPDGPHRTGVSPSPRPGGSGDGSDPVAVDAGLRRHRLPRVRGPGRPADGGRGPGDGPGEGQSHSGAR